MPAGQFCPLWRSGACETLLWVWRRRASADGSAAEGSAAEGSAAEGPKVVVAVLLGVALGAGLSAIGPTSASPSASSVEVAGAVVQRDLVPGAASNDAAERGVLRVEASGCGEQRQASLTVLETPRGPVAVTNAHVVRGSGTVTAHLGDRAEELVVLGAVAGRDLAVLEAPVALGDAALPVGRVAPVGTAVLVAGFPDGAPSAGPATVRTIEARTARGVTSEVLVADAQVRGGSSGGALIDADGRVVGIVAARDPSTGHAVAHPSRDAVTGALEAVPSC